MTETPDGSPREECSLALVGSGGVGVMTTGELVLATAAACGLYGVMTKSYGPQVRGGESTCFLRLGSMPFDKQPESTDLLVIWGSRGLERIPEEVVLHPESWVVSEQTEHAQGVLPAGIVHRPQAWKHLLARIGNTHKYLNMVIFGMLCHLLGLREDQGLAALDDRLTHMDRDTEQANARAFRAGVEEAKQQWPRSPFSLAVPERVTDRWLLTGNEGIVVGSLAAGLDFFAGYPITPATEIMEGLGRFLPRRGGTVLQAEDELAAINMAIGASFGGRKAMTATSGPGFSLMAEGLGLALMAEIPLVVVDVQRVGPSTGIATKTEQSDLWAALGSSHGDNPRVVVAPSSVRDCITTTVEALNLAERLRVPVVLLSDQFLAGRTDILDRLPLDILPIESRPIDCDSKGLSSPSQDAQEDPVRPMAIPGTMGGAYVAEGAEHDRRGWPRSSPDVHQSESLRRLRKLDLLAVEPGWVDSCGPSSARIALMGWGSTAGVVREVVRRFEITRTPIKGIIPRLLYPPQPTVMEPLMKGLDRLYVVELSAMQQFTRYLQAFYSLPAKVVSIARAGGRPFRTEEVVAALEADSIRVDR